MKYLGYHRTSSKMQHLDRGILEIKKFCQEKGYVLKKVYCDQCSGTNFNRPRYTVMKEDVLDEGDTLIITELDRLGRDKNETLKELQYFKQHNIRVMVLELPTTLMNIEIMENSLARMMLETINNMMIEFIASLSHAEMEKRKKRQREGIETKKLRGEWDDYGRPRKMLLSDFGKKYEDVISGKIKPFELMKELGLKESTFYKYKKEYLQFKNTP